MEDLEHRQDVIKKIKEQIENNKIVLYMKGSPQFPECGFSQKVVSIMNILKIDFFSVDVLSNPEIRQALPKYADWPTFPQLYILGELIGGCDIISEMYESGELQKLLKKVA